MRKVVVEQPRYGSRNRSRKTAQKIRPVEVHEDFDSGPVRAPSSRWEKSFGEHLTPLWRFVRRNVGRPWDKVYSEVRSQLDGRSVTGKHVLDHLGWEVTTDVVMVDGKPMHDRWGHRTNVYGFYVDPRTGILREAPSWNAQRRREENNRSVLYVELEDGLMFQRIEDNWFRVAYVENAQTGKRRLVWKQQASRKEVRWIGEQIQAADRGRKGYVRGTRSVKSPAWSKPGPTELPYAA